MAGLPEGNVDSEEEDDEPVRKSHHIVENFKNLWAKYGVVGIGTYLSVYAATLTLLALAVQRCLDRDRVVVEAGATGSAV